MEAASSMRGNTHTRTHTSLLPVSGAADGMLGMWAWLHLGGSMKRVFSPQYDKNQNRHQQIELAENVCVRVRVRVTQ